MTRYGPSPVTATAVAVVKNVACKILGIPPSRVLSRPHCIATPNRISFELTHPDLPSNIENKSIVDIRQEIDKEVNRMIRADIPIEVYHNMTLSQLLNRFGEHVIDRYYDINESSFAKWLFNEYKNIMNKPIWNNYLEQSGPFIWRKRYQNIEGIQMDQKQSIKQFLNEINGQEIDLLPERKRKYFMKRRHWMRETGQIPNDSKDISENESEFELVTGFKWTHNVGVFERKTNTNYSNAHNDLKFHAYNIDSIGCGLCLPNHFSRHWNSQNIQIPIHYLKSTAELGRIVVYQMRIKREKVHSIKFNIDVFPGYNSHIIGPNPYYMFRETFNIKHLASIIPDDHDLIIPILAQPIDLNQLVHNTDNNNKQVYNNEIDEIEIVE
eukprot:226006_1